MGLLDLIRGKEEPATPVPVSQGRPFHITIGTVSVEGFNIENSIRMLRSALVYADKIKLCSFTTSRVLSLFAEYNLGPEDYLDWIRENFLPYISDQQAKANYSDTLARYDEIFRRKRQRKRLTSDELKALERLQYERRKRIEEMRLAHPFLTQDNDIRGIQIAINADLVELHTFKTLNEQDLIVKNLSGIEVRGNPVYDEFVNIVSEALANRATYPLFDDTTGNLVKSLVDDKSLLLSDIKVQKAKHSAFAANLFERLPDFSLVQSTRSLIFDERSMTI